MADSRAIGIFDSGLGGLTVVREIRKQLPNENIIYFGDTGRVPYGTRSHKTIKKYAAQDERFLLSHDVKLIVAACGTVSSVALEETSQLSVPFVEVVSHSVNEAAAVTKNGKIGVLATAATIRSGAHKNKLLSLIPDAQVVQNSGTLLVHMVEEGWIDKNDPVVIETVRRYVAPMIDADVDTLILGCTHFPILAEVIAKVMGDGVNLINMGVATARAVKNLLEQTDSLTESKNHGSHSFYVSDKTASFAKTAAVLLGEKIDENSVELVDINCI